MKKSVAYLLGADMIAQSNRELGNDIVRSNRELGEKLENISKAEIKSKDRIDISLEEYESMKSQIKSLSYTVDKLSSILERIEVPLDKEIIPDSIRTFWCDDSMNFRRIFRVEFAIDDFDLREYRGLGYEKIF